MRWPIPLPISAAARSKANCAASAPRHGPGMHPHRIASAQAEHENRPEGLAGACQLRGDPVDVTGRERSRRPREDERRRDQPGHDADREDEEHRHEHKLGRDGGSRADLELDPRDAGVHRDVQERDRERELRARVQEDGGEHCPGDERRAEPPEDQACAMLELLVHAGSPRPTAHLDQVFVVTRPSPYAPLRRYFPSIQGWQAPFLHPKG